MSEAELIGACLMGKPAAQRALYERFAGRLMSLCRRYGRDRMEAEDMHQKGWLKIFDKLHQCREPSGPALEVWLRRVMVTTCLNHLKAQQRHKIWQNELPPESQNTHGHDPHIVLSEAEALQAAVLRLPECARMVFNLFAVEGYSHGEIAQMMGIAEGTSRSQLNRARQLLQVALFYRTPKPQKA